MTLAWTQDKENMVNLMKIRVFIYLSIEPSLMKNTFEDGSQYPAIISKTSLVKHLNDHCLNPGRKQPFCFRLNTKHGIWFPSFLFQVFEWTLVWIQDMKTDGQLNKNKNIFLSQNNQI